MSQGHFANANYHLRMIDDRIRTEAFQKAIEELVKPGMTVVDLGAGTGILSMFAARAGARKVYAIEAAPIARLARRIIKDNKLDHIIEVIEADARTVTLPEKVDLLVSECLGTFAFSDAMFNVLADCKRFLKPDGVLCPNHVTVKLAPASMQPLISDLNGWDAIKYGFTMSVAKQSAANDVHCIDAPSTSLRSYVQTWLDFKLSEPVQDHNKTLTWTFPKPCIVDSIVGWFTARLSPNIVLDTAPGINTHWGQVIFPLPSTEMDTEDRLKLNLSVSLDSRDKPEYQWKGEFTDKNGKNAIPFSRSQRQRFDPEPED